MDVHCDCAEPPTTAVGEQPTPSGKLNKTAFKLFKRRKSGGAMPSIFGVRGGKGKSGEGGGGGQAGMVRSKTHDGLAEAVLESGKKEEEPGSGDGGGADDHFVVGGDGGAKEPSSSAAAASSCSSAAVGKSHSFFSLLRKNGRSGEGGKGERQKGRGGLKGLFSSMRWHRRDKPGGSAKEDEAGESPESQPSLLMPGSLTASLECIKEEAPPRPPAPAVLPSPAGSVSGDHLLAPQAATEAAVPTQEKQEVDARREPPQQLAPRSPQVEEPPRIQSQAKESLPEPPVGGDGQATPEDSAITGCGDIIADQEDDVGSGGGSGGGGGSDKNASGAAKPGAPKKPPSVVTYQGGGEEMASPEQVGDTCTPEFWDMLSQTEEKSQGTTGARTESLEASKDGSCAKRIQDVPTTEKHIGFNQIPAHHSHKEEQKSREKEQQEAIPSSDEGYWDSTTPGPEEDNTNSIQKEVIPRDSYSGDALYDLYADPDESTAAVTSAEDIASVTCCKPLSPVTTTCPVKTHTTSLKDSKIPISIKHFTSPHGSHGPDASNSHHIAHHQPTKSEIPRTKIPVSKVLVHRASYRSLAGTTGKAATYHESAKK
ncbi:APC membrane recruitment protein 2 [Hemicordylus capensis]|uniref:APC membrane recruitment protein 2 n=1 Tax=Hemicordylus capensis TaxID=884348 RepID=UPI0023040997|nr:APC membrane recruitment protein 2 [Hemicordylus capensis]